MRMYAPTEKEERLAAAIVHSAFAVHKFLGPGLIESVYQECLCYEFRKRGVPYQKQKKLPLIYDGLIISEGLRLDLLVGERLICELKAVQMLAPVHIAQLLSELKLADLHLGFLINFHVERIKDGIRRVIRS
jgi:GxxExxY protein